MPLLAPCRLLATAEERAAVEEAITSRVFEPGMRGILVLGGDTREYDIQNRILSGAPSSLAALLGSRSSSSAIRISPSHPT